MLEHRTEIEVRYAETDMMGVVYHGSYLPWLEVGRTALLASAGLPYRELEAQGFFLPVVEVGMRYLKPARYPDRVTVVTMIERKPSARLRLDYRLERAGETIANAFTVHTFINAAGRPVRPPPAFARVMEERFADGATPPSQP